MLNQYQKSFPKIASDPTRAGLAKLSKKHPKNRQKRETGKKDLSNSTHYTPPLSLFFIYYYFFFFLLK